MSCASETISAPGSATADELIVFLQQKMFEALWMFDIRRLEEYRIMTLLQVYLELGINLLFSYFVIHICLFFDVQE